MSFTTYNYININILFIILKIYINEKSMLIGELSALATAIFWSFSTIYFTRGIANVGVMQINIDRIFLSAVFVWITLFIAGIYPSMSFSQCSFLVLSGLSGLVLGDTFLFKAFDEIGPRLSQLIMAFSPPLAAILAYIFLDESLSLWGILGIIVTSIGIFLVILEHDEDSNRIVIKNKMGAFWAMLGMIGQAGGLVLAKQAFRESNIDPIVASGVRLLSAFILLLPIGYMTKHYHFGIKPYKSNMKWLVDPFMGSILGPYFGMTLSMFAIAYAKVGVASTIMAITPILMLPIAHFAFKEKLTWKPIIGTVVAVFGIAILFLK